MQSVTVPWLLSILLQLNPFSIISWLFVWIIFTSDYKLYYELYCIIQDRCSMVFFNETLNIKKLNISRWFRILGNSVVKLKKLKTTQFTFFGFFPRWLTFLQCNLLLNLWLFIEFVEIVDDDRNGKWDAEDSTYCTHWKVGALGTTLK